MVLQRALIITASVAAVAFGALAQSAPEGATTAATVQVAQDDTYGTYLVDADGMALYVTTADEPTADGAAPTPTCVDACADAWPPYTVTGEPTAGSGVAGTLLGTVARPDGSQQVTYFGQPLYRSSQDQAAGDVNGEAVDDTWYLISPYGGAIKPKVAPAPPSDESAMAGAMQTPEEMMTAGATIFATNCSMCHGPQGAGDVGPGPKLANNQLLGNTQFVITQVEHGGRVMPPFGNKLSDSEVAAVLTYIRGSWGNSFAPVTTKEVTAGK